VHLSARHLRRPRLTDVLAGEPLAVVEAPGGYGKSMLAAEYRESLGTAAVRVALEPGDGDPPALHSRLRRALEGAGFAEAAGRLEPGGGPDDPLAAVIDVVVGWREPLLLVIDNLIQSTGRSAALLGELAHRLPARHRLLLCGRALPPQLAWLRRAEACAWVDAEDLTFTPTEALALSALHGVAIGEHDARTLVRGTGGWAAALRLAIPQLARTEDVAAAINGLDRQAGVLGPLVQAALDTLCPADRAAVVQLAHLPTLDAATIEDAADAPGLVARALEAGIPLSFSRGGTVEMVGPVAEHLRGLALLDPDVARRAADAYRRRGDVVTALRTLQRADLGEDAAALLADLPAVDRVDYADLRPIVEALPQQLLAAHPRALVHFANACDVAGEPRRRWEALRAAAHAVAAPDTPPALVREVDAACARELLDLGRRAEAAALAAALLRAATPAEAATRAHCAEVLGRVAATPGQPFSLRHAEQRLEQAAGVWQRLGEAGWAARVLVELAADIDYPAGRHAAAVARCDEALAILGGRTRQRAAVLTSRARMLIDCGRYEEAEGNLAEAAHLATVMADHRCSARISWAQAVAASQRGDRPATCEHLAAAERLATDRLEPGERIAFLTEAAQLLDRVGQHTQAWGFLERARAEAGGPTLATRIARAVLHARAGDPDEAEVHLAALTDEPLVEPRERWRLTLLRAAAAERRGDRAAAALAAEAFDQAAALGAPLLPLVRERTLAERLGRLAAARSPHVAALSTDDLPTTVVVLGRFRVSRAGEDITPQPGVVATLLKFLAVSGGRAHVEEIAEALWAEVEPRRGRARLRNVLNRLRTTSGDLVVRDGDVLALAGGIDVDLVAFTAEAQAALAEPDETRAAALGRSAVARCRGEVLPDDRYAEWAAESRERARWRLLTLLDLLVDNAERHDRLDEALRLLERALDVDPDDEDRYLRAARLLLAQARRGGALRMLRRARALSEALELPPSPALVALERAARGRQPDAVAEDR
jgi:DNA-binding SARP family transcriptional activator/ATP/maltotriose-dependent transcriptional regulator MalT